MTTGGRIVFGHRVGGLGEPTPEPIEPEFDEQKQWEAWTESYNLGQVPTRPTKPVLQPLYDEWLGYLREFAAERGLRRGVAPSRIPTLGQAQIPEVREIAPTQIPAFGVAQIPEVEVPIRELPFGVPGMLRGLFPHLFTPVLEATADVFQREPTLVLESLITQAREDLDAFLFRIYEMGRSADTELLLQTLMPDLTHEDIIDFFAPVDPFVEVTGAVNVLFPEFQNNVEGFTQWVGESSENAYEFFQTTYDAIETGNRQEVLALYMAFGITGEDIMRLYPQIDITSLEFKVGTLFKPYTGDSFWGTAASNITAGIGDMLVSAAGAVQLFGFGAPIFDTAAEVLSDVGSPLQRVAQPPDLGEFEFADMLDPEFYATKVARTIPFSLLLLPLGFGGFYAGSALAAKVGLSPIWRWIVGGITGAAFSRPAESALEAGGAYNDAITRGLTTEEAKTEGFQVFRENMLLVGADAFEIAVALAPTPKWVPRALIKQGLVRTAIIGGRMIIVGLSEGGEEIYQDFILRKARGEEWEWDPISKEVFAIGFIMGAGMGLAGEVVQNIIKSSRAKMSSDMTIQFDNSFSEFKAEGFTDEQANLRALNDIVKTPEGAELVQDVIQEEMVPKVVVPIVPGVAEIQIPGAPKGETVPSEVVADIHSMTREEFIAKNADLVVKEKGRWGTIHYALKTRKADYQRVGQIVSDAVEDTLGKLYDRFAEVAPPIISEVKPEVKVPTVEEVAIRAEQEELIPESIVAETPILKDIGIKEQARPARKVFQKIGLYEEIQFPAFEAEIELAETLEVYREETKVTAKLIGKNKERRAIVFREANESGSQTGLTFDEKRAVLRIRDWADRWADKKGLPQSKRIKNYIPHLFEAEVVRQIKEGSGIDPIAASVFNERSKAKIADPFLKERLGKELGLIEDPIRAMEAYDTIALRIYYYQPLLNKLNAYIAAETTPGSVKDALRDYARRMTNKPHKWDILANNTIKEFAPILEKFPLGKWMVEKLNRGNAMGMISYNLTGALYGMWLGWKATSAIRNLGQQTLVLAEIGPVHFAESFTKRYSEESSRVFTQSLVRRSRKLALLQGLDTSMQAKWTRAYLKSALFMFRTADGSNVRTAFLGGYYEAKSIFPEAGEDVWIARGDEVAADTQYLYTKMNSPAWSRNSIGRVLFMLTSWTINWVELMFKWIGRRPSYVYQAYTKKTGEAMPIKNWSMTYKAILLYMMIIAAGYAIKEKTKLRAWEYTGLTSVRYLAGLLSGDFPALQYPGAVAELVAGIVTDDERMRKSGLSKLKPVNMMGIVRQIDAVANGEKDWLTLLFYLEGKNYFILQLKDEWQKGWKEYGDIEKAKDRDEYRKAHPDIEAQMFITGKFTTLSSDEARIEVLRLIEKHDLDTDLIEGYEKVFGVDTDIELAKLRKGLGEAELDEEGNVKLKENGDIDYYTTSNFASDINALVKTMGRNKVTVDGNELAVMYLNASDLWGPYFDLEDADARTLYRQQFPDVEAQLYLWGKIASFKNPKSALILLGLMNKYNIPPESIPAFLEKPERYDALFTDKFKLEQKWFDLTTEYENYGNPESDVYLEDSDARKEARDNLKEGNPSWVADMRRIEAIDNEASPEVIEGWVERGKVIDEFGAGSSEAKIWLLDNKEVWDWALGQELLTDDGSGWNEPVLRINKKWATQDDEYNEGIPNLYRNVENKDERDAKIAEAREKMLARNEEYRMDRIRRDAYNDVGPEPDYRRFTEVEINQVVAYYELPAGGFRQERYLVDNPDFADAMHEIKGLDIPEKVPDVGYDEIYEEWQELFEEYDGYSDHTSKYYIEDPDKRDEAREALLLDRGEITEFGIADLERDAHKLYFPDDQIQNYIEYYTMDLEGKPDTWPENETWYEPLWFLAENKSFYEVAKELKDWEAKDFRIIPSKEVWELYLVYINLPKGQVRKDFRARNLDLDAWLVLAKGLTPIEGRGSEETDLSAWEELAEKIREIEEHLRALK